MKKLPITLFLFFFFSALFSGFTIYKTASSRIDADVNKIAFKLTGEVVSASCLAYGTAVPVERTASGDAVVTVVRPGDDDFDCVVKIVIK